MSRPPASVVLPRLNRLQETQREGRTDASREHGEEEREDDVIVRPPFAALVKDHDAYEATFVKRKHHTLSARTEGQRS